MTTEQPPGYRVGTKSPVNIWLTTPGEPDVQVAMCRTDHMASELVAAANDGAAAKTMLRRIGILDGMVVESDEKNGDLIVIVEGLPDAERDRFRLIEVEQGEWEHRPSGVSGNLGHVLRAIARSYDEPAVLDPAKEDR